MKKKLFVLFLVVAAFALQVEAAIDGYVYLDYYSVFKHSNSAYNGQHGFWLRRIYFTYNRDISDKLKARLRLEMNSDGKFSSAKLTPYVKDAYISYSFHALHSLTAGIQESLAYANIEKFWGYRSVEKTALDLLGIRSSRDFGLALKGSFDKEKKYSYALMYGNVSGDGTETNKEKGIYARITLNPVKKFIFEFYFDSLKTSSTVSSNVFSAFAGYSDEKFRLGGNYNYFNTKVTGKDDVKVQLIQLIAALKPFEKAELFFRYDFSLDPLTSGQSNYFFIDKGYKTSILIAGFSYELHPKVLLQPNLKHVSYQENNGVKPGACTIGALTIYYIF